MHGHRSARRWPSALRTSPRPALEVAAEPRRSVLTRPARLKAPQCWTPSSGEVTFSRYGERGSIDILAWHAATGTLLVIEIKTVIVDVQSLLAGLDRKVRNAPFIARERGWQPQAVVPVLIVLEGTTARRRIAEHPALFARFALRGRAGSAWLRNPVGGPAPRGILLMTKLPKARSDDRRRAGRQRIRTNAPVSRSDQAGSGL